jgi:hypothetical protein
MILRKFVLLWLEKEEEEEEEEEESLSFISPLVMQRLKLPISTDHSGIIVDAG